jgi:DNA-binding transcriptional ArsR family regulator
MADHSAPDYELEPELELENVEQIRALFEVTRSQIVDLLLERAATIKELAVTLNKPKGTVGHHVSVLEDFGLIRVVRTKKVRAIVAKYYGRTARTYVIPDSPESAVELAPNHFLTHAAAEYAKASRDDPGLLSTLRHARIPTARAEEWNARLTDLAAEFTAEHRGGETTYGLLIALYPTDWPHLPDEVENA